MPSIDLKIVPLSPGVGGEQKLAEPTTVGIMTRAFIDVAMKTFADLATDAVPGSAFDRSRKALGEERFLEIAREAIERHCAAFLGAAAEELMGAAARVGVVAVDSAVLEIVGKVVQDIGRAAIAAGANGGSR